MTYGKIVARRWKRQYFKRGKWSEMDDWQVQPEAHYRILLELKSKKAIELLLNASWTKYLPVKPKKSKKERS